MDRPEDVVVDWRSSEIIGYRVVARNGKVGAVKDLLFEDDHWIVRWVVVDTGTWLSGREVLLPPLQLSRPDAARQEFSVDLDRKTVEESPGIALDQPVSRQMEAILFRYYSWQPYWVGAGYAPPVAGTLVAPVGPTAMAEPPPAIAPAVEVQGDSHLRSVDEVTGYYIDASDGALGHVEEFLVENRGWTVRYLIVDTRNWWPGKKVLVSTNWVRRIDWAKKHLGVDLSRDQVRNSPEYDPSAALDRAYEDQLWRHYGYAPDRL